MKRNPRKLRWTKAFRKTHNKDMTVDTTIEFEQRRNRPMRYHREKMHTTLKAMKRVAEVREKRERQFYENRMKGKKQQEITAALKDLQEHSHLIEAPAALIEKQRVEIKEKQEQRKNQTEKMQE